MKFSDFFMNFQFQSELFMQPDFNCYESSLCPPLPSNQADANFKSSKLLSPKKTKFLTEIKFEVKGFLQK